MCTLYIDRSKGAHMTEHIHGGVAVREYSRLEKAHKHTHKAYTLIGKYIHIYIYIYRWIDIHTYTCIYIYIYMYLYL